jgi:photosystem II stability/assembly factor-like uncharacterized protein
MHLNSMKRVAVAAMAAAGICAGGPALAAEQGHWTVPQCRSVSGAPNVTMTKNEGAKLAKTSGQMAQYSYAFGLVPLEKANTMLAAVGSKILRSGDAGCHWQPLADLTGDTGNALLLLEPAGGDRAYGWAVNGNALATIDGDTATSTWVPGSGMTGFSVSPGHRRQLRFGDSSGTIWASRDGGKSWASSGGIAGQFVYRTAFDPKDPDHILVGTMSNGAFTSFDGGLTWQAATGFALKGISVNIFNMVVSPANPEIVWAQGINLAEADANVPSQGRHVYRSGDGGRSFSPVVDQDSRVTLTNGPLMVPHPTDASVLYFVFGMSFMNYGTDVYRYDQDTRQVTLTHNGYSEISAIAFHPRYPELMYIGLAND